MTDPDICFDLRWFPIDWYYLLMDVTEEELPPFNLDGHWTRLTSCARLVRDLEIMLDVSGNLDATL